MIVAAVLAITLDPAMRLLFTHMRNFDFPASLARTSCKRSAGRQVHSEEKHPISRILIRLYHPVAGCSLRWKWAVICWRTCYSCRDDAGLPEARLRVHAAAR